jgi:hypothetical protein
MKTLLLTVALLLLAFPALAQMATETTPGVTWYGSPNGGTTLGVETIPGVRFYSGEVTGSSVTLAPGITNYSLQSGSWEDQLMRDVQADLAYRRALDQEFRIKDLEYQLDRERRARR